MTLLPEVADSLRGIGMANIPLVAAGGIVEGRGSAACLALGGCGVVMGTRSLASRGIKMMCLEWMTEGQVP